MPHWLIKSAIHRVISILPQSQKCNEWFQQNITKSLDLGPGDFELKLNFCRRYLDDFLELRPECADGFKALELGTGWYPTVPLGLYLCGAADVWSFDLHPNINRSRFNTLFQLYCDYDRDGRLQKFLPKLRPERMAHFRQIAARFDGETPETLLRNFNIHLLIRNAQNTGLPSNSIDLFFSCAVLEYVPAEAQEKIYAEFRRLASPRAVMIHFINLKDQFAVFDRSITVLNFLQYSSRVWKWLDSPLIPLTRLRVSDYRTLLTKAGFAIKKEVNASAAPGELEKIHLAPEFQNYSREDLLVVETWLVTKAP